MNRYVPLTAILAGALSLLFVLGGCDSLSSYNENPNDPTEANPNNVLANAQRDLNHELYDANDMMRGSNLWAQYTTQNFYPTESRYGSVNYPWTGIYTSLNDLREVKNLTRQEGLVANPENVRAVATITQVWAFQILTDAFGDIPYGEALQGARNRSPAYTPQSEIYPALLDSLDVALNEINSDPGPSGDLIYGGDMEKWRRFANGLKMRIGIRMADVNSSAAEAAITEANGNALQSNEDNAYFQFATSSTHRNQYYQNRVVQGRDDFDASDRFVNAMKDYGPEDPRMDAYFEQTSSTEPACEDGSGNYEGFPFGMEQGNAQNLYSANPSCEFSRPEAWWLRGPSGEGDAFSPLMYYDEVLFIKAEAVERGYINGSAEDFLEEAIRASIDFYGAQTDADIDGSSAQADQYVSAVRSAYSSSNWRQVLGEQKWIALYMNDIQGWSTWRRLDFGGHIGTPTGGLAQDLRGQYAPLRIDYPESEYNLNNDNVTEAAERQFESIDAENPGSRLWWDANEPPADPY